MLIKVQKLEVIHEGFQRVVHFKDVYINSQSIITVSDYMGARNFLLSENSPYLDKPFSLLKVGLGQEVEEMIVLGSAEAIFGNATQRKKILND